LIKNLIFLVWVPPAAPPVRAALSYRGVETGGLSAPVSRNAVTANARFISPALNKYKVVCGTGATLLELYA